MHSHQAAIGLLPITITGKTTNLKKLDRVTQQLTARNIYALFQDCSCSQILELKKKLFLRVFFFTKVKKVFPFLHW